MLFQVIQYDGPYLKHKGKYIELSTVDENPPRDRRDQDVFQKNTGYYFKEKYNAREAKIRASSSTSSVTGSTSQEKIKQKTRDASKKWKDNHHKYTSGKTKQIVVGGSHFYGQDVTDSSISRLITKHGTGKRMVTTNLGEPHAECIGHNCSPVGKQGLSRTRVFHSPVKRGTFYYDSDECCSPEDAKQQTSYRRELPKDCPRGVSFPKEVSFRRIQRGETSAFKPIRTDQTVTDNALRGHTHYQSIHQQPHSIYKFVPEIQGNCKPPKANSSSYRPISAYQLPNSSKAKRLQQNSKAGILEAPMYRQAHFSGKRYNEGHRKMTHHRTNSEPDSVGKEEIMHCAQSQSKGMRAELDTSMHKKDLSTVKVIPNHSLSLSNRSVKDIVEEVKRQSNHPAFYSADTATDSSVSKYTKDSIQQQSFYKIPSSVSKKPSPANSYSDSYVVCPSNISVGQINTYDDLPNDNIPSRYPTKTETKLADIKLVKRSDSDQYIALIRERSDLNDTRFSSNKQKTDYLKTNQVNTIMKINGDAKLSSNQGESQNLHSAGSKDMGQSKEGSYISLPSLSQSDIAPESCVFDEFPPLPSFLNENDAQTCLTVKPQTLKPEQEKKNTDINVETKMSYNQKEGPLEIQSKNISTVIQIKRGDIKARSLSPYNRKKPLVMSSAMSSPKDITTESVSPSVTPSDDTNLVSTVGGHKVAPTSAKHIKGIPSLGKNHGTTSPSTNNSTRLPITEKRSTSLRSEVKLISTPMIGKSKVLPERTSPIEIENQRISPVTRGRSPSPMIGKSKVLPERTSPTEIENSRISPVTRGRSPSPMIGKSKVLPQRTSPTKIENPRISPVTRGRSPSPMIGKSKVLPQRTSPTEIENPRISPVTRGRSPSSENDAKSYKKANAQPTLFKKDRVSSPDKHNKMISPPPGNKYHPNAIYQAGETLISPFPLVKGLSSADKNALPSATTNKVLSPKVDGMFIQSPNMMNKRAVSPTVDHPTAVSRVIDSEMSISPAVGNTREPLPSEDQTVCSSKADDNISDYLDNMLLSKSKTENTFGSNSRCSQEQQIEGQCSDLEHSSVADLVLNYQGKSKITKPKRKKSVRFEEVFIDQGESSHHADCKQPSEVTHSLHDETLDPYNKNKFSVDGFQTGSSPNKLKQDSVVTTGMESQTLVPSFNKMGIPISIGSPVSATEQNAIPNPINPAHSPISRSMTPPPVPDACISQFVEEVLQTVSNDNPTEQCAQKKQKTDLNADIFQASSKISDFADMTFEPQITSTPHQSQEDVTEVVKRNDSAVHPEMQKRHFHNGDSSTLCDTLSKDTVKNVPIAIPDPSNTLHDVITSPEIAKKLKTSKQIAQDPDVGAMIKQMRKRRSTSDERNSQENGNKKAVAPSSIGAIGRTSSPVINVTGASAKENKSNASTVPVIANKKTVLPMDKSLPVVTDKMTTFPDMNNSEKIKLSYKETTNTPSPVSEKRVTMSLVDDTKLSSTAEDYKMAPLPATYIKEISSLETNHSTISPSTIYSTVLQITDIRTKTPPGDVQSISTPVISKSKTSPQRTSPTKIEDPRISPITRGRSPTSERGANSSENGGRRPTLLKNDRVSSPDNDNKMISPPLVNKYHTNPTYLAEEKLVSPLRWIKGLSSPIKDDKNTLPSATDNKALSPKIDGMFIQSPNQIDKRAVSPIVDHSTVVSDAIDNKMPISPVVGNKQNSFPSKDQAGHSSKADDDISDYLDNVLLSKCKIAKTLGSNRCSQDQQIEGQCCGIKRSSVADRVSNYQEKSKVTKPKGNKSERVKEVLIYKGESSHHADCKQPSEATHSLHGDTLDSYNKSKFSADGFQTGPSPNRLKQDSVVATGMKSQTFQNVTKPKRKKSVRFEDLIDKGESSYDAECKQPSEVTCSVPNETSGSYIKDKFSEDGLQTGSSSNKLKQDSVVATGKDRHSLVPSFNKMDIPVRIRSIAPAAEHNTPPNHIIPAHSPITRSITPSPVPDDFISNFVEEVLQTVSNENPTEQSTKKEQKTIVPALNADILQASSKISEIADMTFEPQTTSTPQQSKADITEETRRNDSVIRSEMRKRRLHIADSSTLSETTSSDTVINDSLEIPDPSNTLHDVITSSGIAKKIKTARGIANDPDVGALIKQMRKRRSTSDERKSQENRNMEAVADLETSQNKIQKIGLAPRDLLMEQIRSYKK